MCSDNEKTFWSKGFLCEVIRAGMVSIGRDEPGVFKECTSYKVNILPVSDFGKELNIPEYVLDENKTKYKVTKIRPSCFDGAGNIEVLHIPDSISLMEWCFWECNNLKEIRCSSRNLKYCDIDGVVFSRNKRQLLFYPIAYPADVYKVPESTIEIGNKAFKMASNLKTLYIPESVQHIGINAFYGCFNLEHVYIEGELKSFHSITTEAWEPKKAVFHYQDKTWSFNKLWEAFSQRKQ